MHNQLLMSAFHLSEANMDLYVAAIRKFGAQALDGYPSTLYVLARHLLKRKQTLPLMAAITSSETLYSFQREAIEEAYCCRVFDYFAGAERVVFATECEAHEGKHVASEYGVLEFIDKNGAPAVTGNSGMMVGTSLHNRGMPLIRYLCNDASAFKIDRCSCGRNLPLMQDVSTKAEDVIALSDGRMISPSVLTHPFKPMHSIEESQIVQEDYDHIVIKIKTKEHFPDEQVRYLQREFRKRLGAEVSIEVRIVDAIARTKAGKFKWVISKVDRAIQVH
jgi:phenylacetate-CoA ligase